MVALYIEYAGHCRDAGTTGFLGLGDAVGDCTAFDYGYLSCMADQHALNKAIQNKDIFSVSDPDMLVEDKTGLTHRTAMIGVR